MMKIQSHMLYIVAGVLVIGVGLFVQKKLQRPEGGADAGELRVKTIAQFDGGELEPVQTRRPRGRKRDSASRAAVKESAVKEKPVPDDADESELTELQSSVLKELKKALDDNSLPRVRKAIAKFNQPKAEGGLDGDVPKVMRSYAVSALGWFGSAAISDLLEFAADADTEIEDDAFTKMEEALDDWDVSDYERASILTAMLKALHDSDRIDMMLMALNNMRNSVKGDAIINIINSGTDEAKAVMKEQVEFYTDLDVVDAQGVAEWVKNNPDNEWDEEFYGAQKQDEE